MRHLSICPEGSHETGTKYAFIKETTRAFTTYKGLENTKAMIKVYLGTKDHDVISSHSGKSLLCTLRWKPRLKVLGDAVLTFVSESK